MQGDIREDHRHPFALPAAQLAGSRDAVRDIRLAVDEARGFRQRHADARRQGIPPGDLRLLGSGGATRSHGPRRRGRADHVRDPGAVRLSAPRGPGVRMRAHLQRRGARAVRRSAAAAEVAVPGATAGHRSRLPRAESRHGGRPPRRAHRQPRGRARARRRRHHHLPAALRGRGRRGVRASLGHDGERAHVEVHAAVAGGDAGGDAAVDPVADPVRLVRAPAAS